MNITRLKNRFTFFVVFLLVFPFCVLAQEKEDLMKKSAVDRSKAFGVLDFLCWNHPWNNFQYPDKTSIEKTVALMKEAGVSIVRTDFLWQDLEIKPNQWDFKKYDQFVKILNKNKIEVLGIFGYCADWASPCNKWNVLGDNHEHFLNYVRKTVKHYKGKVKYWEIWNEPDSHIYWEDQDGLKNYCVLLGRVYKAIKEECPECYVLNGGLANGISSVNKIYDNGAKDFFDIFNIHVFNNPKDPNAVKKTVALIKMAYKIMKRSGDANKKIWVTETGCPGASVEDKIDNWWMGANPDEKEQAKYLNKVYEELLKIDNVEKVFWAFWRDTQHWGNGIDRFGIIRRDFSKKPAFSAYKAEVEKVKTASKIDK